MLKEELENDYGIPVVASPLEAVTTARDKLKTKEFFAKKWNKYSLFIVDFQKWTKTSIYL